MHLKPKNAWSQYINITVFDFDTETMQNYKQEFYEQDKLSTFLIHLLCSVSFERCKRARTIKITASLLSNGK